MKTTAKSSAPPSRSRAHATTKPVPDVRGKAGLILELQGKLGNQGVRKALGRPDDSASPLDTGPGAQDRTDKGDVSRHGRPPNVPRTSAPGPSLPGVASGKTQYSANLARAVPERGARQTAATQEWEADTVAALAEQVPGRGKGLTELRTIEAGRGTTTSPAGSDTRRESPAVEEALGQSVPRSLMSSRITAKVEGLLGSDLQPVPVHDDPLANRAASALQARAFTAGGHVFLGPGESAGDVPLMAHEAVHAHQQLTLSGNGQVTTADAATNSVAIQRKTTGESAVDHFWKKLNQKKDLKVVVDRLKSAAREIAKEKALDYHRKKTPALVERAADILKLNAKRKAALLAEWNAYLGAPKTLTPAKREAFFKKLKSPLDKITDKYPKDEAEYRLRHTTPGIMDLIYKVARSAGFPADELWVYAAREGMVDYVRDELAMASDKTFPTRAALDTVAVDKAVSGFDYFGLDVYHSDLKDTDLKKYIPKGMDTSKISEEARINEKGKTVRAAKAANIETALYALAAMLKQRRAKFKKEAAFYGYATPTKEETIYWTYIYYNVGPYIGKKMEGGKGQLKKYKGKRKLSDWITKGEYPNAIKVLETYKAAREIFRGFKPGP